MGGAHQHFHGLHVAWIHQQMTCHVTRLISVVQANEDYANADGRSSPTANKKREAN